MSLFVDIFDGMWETLDADPDVTSLVGNGTKYKWQGGLLQRFDLEPASCPILSLYPAGEIALPYSHIEGPPRLPLDGDVVVDARDVRVGLRLLMAVANALHAEAVAGNRFGVFQLDKLDFSGVSCTLFRTREDAVPLWAASFSVIAQFRLSTAFS